MEDNPGDVTLVAEAFAEAGIGCGIQNVRDGREAIRHLEEAAAGGRPLPDLVLLDLNLPGVGGLEVLSWAKSHPTLKNIPVVVFTGSQLDVDLQSSYDRHANCYVTKPNSLEEYHLVVTAVFDFWSRIVCLPSYGLAANRQPGKAVTVDGAGGRNRGWSPACLVIAREG